MNLRPLSGLSRRKQMKQNNFSAIVLAAGEGKRMKSEKSKVLHEVAGTTLIERTITTIKDMHPAQIICVANKKNITEMKKMFKNQVLYVLQSQPKGTGDAALLGLGRVKKNIPVVCVMYGDDTAFYKPKTIGDVYAHHLKSEAVATFVTVKLEDPAGFGRIIKKNGKVTAIIEEKDATAIQKKINEINDGVYFFEKDWLSKNIRNLKPSKVTGELYITDMVEEAIRQKKKVETYALSDSGEWHSVNTPQDLKKAQEKHIKNIHIMGILGAGASAVAGIAKGYGYNVTGCDLISNSPYAKNLGVSIYKGHDPSHLKNVGMLILSPSVQKLDPYNREIEAAKKLKIPVLTWQEFQGKFLQKGKYTIAVAGAYGKSTTTAMISQILIDQNLDPTCEIGAEVLDWDANFKIGKSIYYVCEADEYNNNFLNYKPDIAVILNVSWDHPDFFKTKKSVIGSYKKFIGNIKSGGYLVVGESSGLAMLSKFRKDIKIEKAENFGKLNLSLIGRFREENANTALTVSKILNLDVKKSKQTLEKFKGLARRLEYKGEINNVKVYDDYAVQPYTVLKTVNALEEKFKGKRIALVFEPHTFSRVRVFFDDFAKNLSRAKTDSIFVTEVYAAREIGDNMELAKKLVGAIGKKAKFTGSLDKTVDYLKQNLTQFDVILSCGAGNSYKLWDLLNTI